MQNVLSHRSVRFASRLLALAPAVFAAQAAFGIDFNFSPTFETSKQSLFGSGSAPISISKDAQFLGAQWNTSATISAGNPNGGNGFSLTGSTSGKVGLEYGLKLDSGSIDASLPFDVKISAPNANTLVSGQSFIVDTSATFRASEGYFDSRSPTFQFYSDFIFQAKAALSGKASVDLFFFNKQVNFAPTTILDVNGRQELIALNRDNDGEIRVLPFLFSAASTAKDAYDSAQAAKELKTEVDAATGRREKVKIALKKVGVTFSLESPLEASVRLPYIEMHGESLTGTGTKLTKTDKDGFADFSFDLDRIASIAIPQIPPMTVNADIDLVVGGIEASATVVDVDFNPTLNLTQSATVDAKGVNIAFDFGRTINAAVLNADNTVAIAAGLRTGVTMKAGQKLSIVYDGQDMNLTPTYSVDASLSSQFGLSISSEIAFKALMASVEAKLFGFDIGGFSLGPVFQSSIQFPDVSLGNLFDQTFALGGFNSVTGSSVFISNKATQFEIVNGNWNNAAGWKIGSTGGILPDVGRSAVLAPNLGTVTSSDPANGCFDLSIGVGTTLNAGILTVNGDIYNNGALVLNDPANGINMKYDAVSKGAHAIVGGQVTLAGGDIRIVNDSGNSSLVSSLTLSNTSVYGYGNGGIINDDNRLMIALSGSTITAGGNVSIGNGSFIGPDIVKLGATPSKLSAINNGILTLRTGSVYTVFPNGEPSAADMVANTGSAREMLEINAGAGSTVRIEGTSTGNGIRSGIRNLYTGVRFTTSGSGTILNRTFTTNSSLALSGIINDGLFQADPSTIAGGVTTYFYDTALTGSATSMPIVNNGLMQFVSRPGADSFLGVGNATVSGKGEIQLIGYGNYAKVGSAAFGAPMLTNNSTIRADFANIGMNQINILNKGSIIVDKTIGAGAGDVTIDPLSTFVNDTTGLVQAKPGATLYLQHGTFTNNGTFEALDLGVISSVTSPIESSPTFTNITSDFGVVTLTGGKYRTQGSGRIYLRPVLNPPATFVNAAELEFSQMYGTPGTQGLFFRTGNITKWIGDFSEIRNAPTGIFALTDASSFNPVKFSNSGLIDLASSTIYDVVNLPGGIVMGSGEVQLMSTLANFAENKGSIIATRNGDSSQLIVSGGPGVNVVDNEGTIGAVGADLFFAPGVVLAKSAPNAVSGGNYLVDGSDAPARLVIRFDSGTLNTISFGNVTLTGSGARLQSQTGNTIQDFQSTLTTLGTDARVLLDSSTQTFTNRIAVTSGAQLLLNGSGTVGGPGLDVAGTVAGNGVVNTPVVMKGGSIQARNGLLRLEYNIENRNTANSTSGKILASSAGGILNPDNIRIDGGYVGITHYAAGLYGTGVIAADTFLNQGVVAAGAATLRFEGTGTFTNSNLITTRERGTVELAGTSPIDNTNGTISAIDTGGLDLQSDGGGIGGTIRLSGATVNNGAVTISGANSKLAGYGTLNNVNLTVANALVNAANSTPAGNILVLSPASGTTGIFYNSVVRAENGADIRLSNGNFEAVGTDLVADGNTGSFIELSNATLNAGTIKTSGSALFKTAGISTLSDTKNLGKVQVSPGSTLKLINTIDNRTGSIDNRGIMNLNNADLVGGSLLNNAGSQLQIAGRAGILGVNLFNAATGLIDVRPVVGDLTVNQSNDGTSSAGSFSNAGTIVDSGKMTVVNQLFTNSGALEITSTGSLTAQTLTQTAGYTRINGTANVTTFNLQGGTLYGSGRITGNLVTTGGTVAPGNSPGTLTVDGDIEISADTVLDLQVESLALFDEIVSTNGDIILHGLIDIDFRDDTLDELLTLENHDDVIHLFDVAPGHHIIEDHEVFEFLGDVSATDVRFDSNTGNLYFHLVPEPSALSLFALPALALSRPRRRRSA